MAGVLKAKVGGQWVPIVGSGMTAEVARWNSAWGTVGYAQVTSNQAGIGTTPTDLTGLSVTFTPVVGRRYVTTASWLGQTNASGSTTAVAVLRDGANVNLMQRNFVFLNGQYSFHPYIQVVETAAAATPITRKATFYITVGTIDMFATASYPAFIEVRDVGPVIYNAAPAPVGTPTAWTAMTLLNGFVQYGGYQLAQYRKVGDVVELRGLIARPSGWAIPSAIVNLPVGFRPATLPSIFVTYVSTDTAASAGRVDVGPTGDVSYQAHPMGTTSSTSIVNFLSLDGIKFSTTA